MIPRSERRSLINEYGDFSAEAQAIGNCFRARIKSFISDNHLMYLRLDCAKASPSGQNLFSPKD